MKNVADQDGVNVTSVMHAAGPYSNIKVRKYIFYLKKRGKSRRQYDCQDQKSEWIDLHISEYYV